MVVTDNAMWAGLATICLGNWFATKPSVIIADEQSTVARRASDHFQCSLITYKENRYNGPGGTMVCNTFFPEHWGAALPTKRLPPIVIGDFDPAMMDIVREFQPVIFGPTAWTTDRYAGSLLTQQDHLDIIVSSEFLFSPDEALRMWSFSQGVPAYYPGETYWYLPPGLVPHPSDWVKIAEITAKHKNLIVSHMAKHSRKNRLKEIISVA